MNILTIIPARGGSKRLPGKNLKKLGGKSLIVHALERAQDANLKTVVLSSDHQDIIDEASDFKDVIALRRPDDISGDKALAITYVKHTLNTLDQDFDAILILQPTSPFTRTQDIQKCIETLHHRRDAESVVSVCALDHALQPSKLKVMGAQGQLDSYFEEEGQKMAQHQLPKLWIRNGSVYLSRIDVIRRDEILGQPCLGVPMPRENSLDINDPLDFRFAEFIYATRGIVGSTQDSR